MGRKTTNKPDLAYAVASQRVIEHANESCLPQRPYARYLDGFGWIVDSVTELSAQYDAPPEHGEFYPVTILPSSYHVR